VVLTSNQSMKADKKLTRSVSQNSHAFSLQNKSAVVAITREHASKL